MKMIVQNEHERELLDRVMNDFFVGIGSEENGVSFDGGGKSVAHSSLNDDEMRLIKQLFRDLVVIVDPTVDEIFFSKGDIVSRDFDHSELNSGAAAVSYSDYAKKQQQGDQMGQLLFDRERLDAIWEEDVLE